MMTKALVDKDGSTSDRSANQTNIVQQHFDAASTNWADRYNQYGSLSNLDLGVRLDVATRMLKEACAEARGPIAILDAGCGTGEGTSRLSESGLKVFATDLSAAMVEKAIRQYHFIHGSVADAVALPFASGSFDIVLSLGVIEYISAYEGAVREFRRVLRPGGTLILSIPNRSSWFRRLHKLDRMLARLMRRVEARLRGSTQKDASRIPTYRHQSWTLTEATRLLNASGFKPLEAKLFTYGFRLPMAEEWTANIALCRWMNAHCNNTTLARHLACTAVLRSQAL